MDAIVTAGGIPGPDEPLYPYTQGKAKAMVDICGKPMIQWVLDALSAADSIDHVLVNGLTAESGLKCSKISAFEPNQGSMLENIRLGVKRILEINPKSDHVMIVSSDVPAITLDAINWVVEAVSKSDLDLYYNLITRQVMEARFPGSKRSYTKLKGLEVCGGDVNVIRTMLATGNDELWERIIAARKNASKQAALVGFDTLFLLLFRLVDLDGAVKKVTRRLNLTGQAILCPYAEIGMDVDKPHQLEMMRADLCKERSS